jgi:hypothetical protein
MAASVPSRLVRSGGGTGNLNLNFKLGHYSWLKKKREMKFDLM